MAASGKPMQYGFLGQENGELPSSNKSGVGVAFAWLVKTGETNQNPVEQG